MTQKKKTYKVVNVCLIFFQGRQEFIYTFQELESPSASAVQVVHTMCCIITRILLLSTTSSNSVVWVPLHGGTMMSTLFNVSSLQVSIIVY